jgi:transposase InsO family protein
VGRRGYPPEFRRKALDLVEAGRPIAEVAQALGISGQSISTWRRRRPGRPQLHPDRPNQLWVTDSTEHPTREGKLSWAVVLDACPRRVVGWSIDATPTAALVTNALGMAIQTRTPPAGAIIHSDPGVQSPPGRSPSGPRTPAWCPRWAASATATTTP